ncbi:Transmembrane emp24 domain-containing protein p24delta3 [Vitis vinifera]|uniref:Transmembrane emp24 domain-containing protein p24delta3 n=1 Tax=Vitis vinifera TaxID=29760 RepID=A0A438C411_VITVI|nr:Transmembrane emp24 domain-containing protein p24delta3 [Vitis vinifera]
MAESGIMLLAATMIMIWWATPSQAIWLSLPSSGTKCVSEEIHNNVVVLLDYSLVLGGDDDPSHPTTISVRVLPKFHSLFHVPYMNWIALSLFFFFHSIYCDSILKIQGLIVDQKENSSFRVVEIIPNLSLVSSPYGQNLYYQEKVTKGQSAFTTSESGAHVACFWLDGNHEEGAGRTIDIDWKIGITAKDWDSVAKKEKIEGVEFELRKLEGIVNAIHENIIFLKER